VDRKLNVALTRAREHMVVVGTPATLNESYHYRQLIEWSIRHNACVDIEHLQPVESMLQWMP